jgi:hypothetical protein
MPCKPLITSPPAFSGLKGLRLLCCMLALLLIAGCSMVRVGYGQLDTLASWMAHDYFAF